MASNEIAGDIQSLETKAESILTEARAKAAEMLRQANLEAAKIMADRPSMDSVKAECAAIVEKARAEAGAAIERAKKEAERVRSRFQAGNAKAFQNIAKKIEGIVRGEH